jgi:predicted ATP-grasp superfamily ATP-dependent carboligase
LLGVTQQLVSETWLHARPFHYCGSIGPLALDSATTLRFESLGDVLARGFGLRGLFGVDCLLHEGIPWPVEVNPRYTASVEVLEYALGTPALALHRAAFDPAAPHTTRAAPCGGIAGKAILHARADDAFPHSGPWQTALASSADPLSALPEYADIPGAGEPMARGQPILTLFARAATVAECLAALRERAHDLDRRLFGR